MELYPIIYSDGTIYAGGGYSTCSRNDNYDVDIGIVIAAIRGRLATHYGKAWMGIPPADSVYEEEYLGPVYIDDFWLDNAAWAVAQAYSHSPNASIGLLVEKAAIITGCDACDTPYCICPLGSIKLRQANEY